jgi:hypothetical protein
MGVEHDVEAGDLVGRVCDRQVDDHVVDRQRLGIALDVEAGRLDVADAAPGDELALVAAVHADRVLAVVQELEAGVEIGNGRGHGRSLRADRLTAPFVSPG